MAPSGGELGALRQQLKQCWTRCMFSSNMTFRFSDYPKCEIKKPPLNNSSFLWIWSYYLLRDWVRQRLGATIHYWYVSHRLLRFKSVLFWQDPGCDLRVAASALLFTRSSLSSLSISSTLAKLQVCACTRTSQRHAVNFLNGVSGTLWLLFIIGSKFKTALVLLPYSLDLNSLSSLVTSPFRTTCSDTDGNVWIVQYSNPSLSVLWTKCYFAVSLLETAALINGIFVFLLYFVLTC